MPAWKQGRLLRRDVQDESPPARLPRPSLQEGSSKGVSIHARNHVSGQEGLLRGAAYPREAVEVGLLNPGTVTWTAAGAVLREPRARCAATAAARLDQDLELDCFVGHEHSLSHGGLSPC